MSSNRIVGNHRKWLYLTLCLCWCVVQQAAAQESELIIEITSGVDRKTAIAVVPFGWSGPGILPVEVADIISEDLFRCGLFETLPKADMLSRPTRPENVAFREWRALQTEYLTIGSVQPDPEKTFKFEFGLFDVMREKPLLIKRGSAGDLRDLAHHVSDQIYEQLTGIPGAFSTQILYVTVEREQGKVMHTLKRADSDGYRTVTLFRSSEPILSPVWSPDGKKVAYVSYHDGRRPAIYIHDIATGQQTRLTRFAGLNGAPDWSPDGRFMAMTLSKDGNPEIYMMEVATGQLTRLTEHFAIDTEPRWMPDGKRLLFTSDRGGGPQIYELELADRSVRRVTFEGSYNARGSVSPDGRYLAMVHRRQGQFHIAVQDLIRGTFDILTRTELDESPTIAPNGSMLMYATIENGQSVLAAVSLDGRVKVRLPARQGGVREPAWSPIFK